ncbi:exo-alpha-sialidase [Streptomyces sp. NBC_01089]|uniref:exo-alpha-sialidase n=1 Tax=Streptomyces sp. NBC_01089 TaxID=2903747 RepID=UPI0038677DCC|nr:exo-alpha-sialidase [Streptomyces sp. NBC_01089]
MALTWRAPAALRRLVVALSAVVATLAAATVATTGPAGAADGSQSAVVSQDCTSSRIRVALLNPTAAATTFTVTWAGTGTWTRTVAAGDRTDLYFSKPSGTDYSFRTTTPQGLDRTTTGTLDCSRSMAAQISAECPRDADGSLPATHRLKLTLVNRSDTSKTFTVAWEGRSGSPWTRTVAARSSDDTLSWTADDGTAYRIRTTATGFDRTESGTVHCGLAAGTPGMNTQTLFSAHTSTGAGTAITGLNRAKADGSGYESYTGTAKSVRIPSMAVTNNGTVIAMADARIDSSSDLGGGSNNIQVAMRRSTDGGVTWTGASAVAHGATTSEGYGDSSLLVDRSAGADGKVFAFINYSPAPGVGYAGSKAGSNSATDPTALHIRVISSTDNGATWSSPVDLNPQVKNVAWAGMFASSGHGIQLSDGRLVQPIVYHQDGADHAGNIYSDDHGATWHAGASAASGVNENKAIQRGSGQVVQNLRSNSGGNRWYATAADTAAGRNVAGAFGPAWNSGLIDPGCNADEISYLRPTDVGAGGYPALTPVTVQSNNASAADRDELTVRMSEDDGVTWPHQVLIKSGAAGYSTTAVLGNGVIGDLYEIGDTGGIVFSSFTPDWARQS